MKKLLSTLLALVMVLTTMAMLIPTISAASEPTPVYYEDFDGDASNGGKAFDTSLTGEELAKALFGESDRRNTYYIMDTTDTVSIVDGALDLRLLTGGDNFLAMLYKDEAVSEQGFIAECEYVFHEGEIDGTTDVATGRWLGFCTKSVMTGSDANTLLAYTYNNSFARIAYRNAATGGWSLLNQIDASTDFSSREVKYKYRATFLPEDGPSLQVAVWDDVAGAYGDYKMIGNFSSDEHKGAYQGLVESEMKDSQKNVFNDMVILNIQHGNSVTIDNLKVTLVEKETYDLTINGEAVSIESAGQLNLAPYFEGTFRFAVVNGTQIVKDSFIDIDENTETIDIYTADVDTLDGAALTTGETTAIRWMASIGKADYDKLVALKTANVIKNVEYGALYIDASAMGRAEAAAGPKMETEGVQKAAGSAVYEPGYEGLYVFNMDSAAIAAEQYNLKLAGRAYLLITFNDDTTMLIEGDYDSGFHARSAAEIALAATLDFENGLSDDQLSKVEAIAEAYGK